MPKDDLDTIRRAIELHRWGLLQRDGVSSVAIGRLEHEGNGTDELATRVGFEVKRGRSDLRADGLLPTELDASDPTWRVTWWNRKQCRYGVLVIAVALALAAFSGASDQVIDNLPPKDPGMPRHGGSITVGLEGETNSYLPGRGQFGAPGVDVALALFDPLVRRDHSGNWRPYLAESVEPNEDYSVWTLTLRPNVRFHDGTPLDAAALKWNFDHLHKVPGSTTWGFILDVERMEIVDELTVRYHLRQGIVAFPEMLMPAFGWPFSPTAAATFGEHAGSNPVGTGPFKFVSWRRDDRLVVERNDDYWWPGMPYLNRIDFRPIPDEDSRLASLKARSIDAMQSLYPSTIAQIRAIPYLHRYEFSGNNGRGAHINTARPPLDDPRIRQSLAWAVYQDAMNDVLGGTDITPIQTQHFALGSPWYSERVAAAWPRNDPERARELLQQYMADPQRSDGRTPGAPVSIEFLCLPEPGTIEIAQMFQALWRAVGFEVRLRQMELAALVQTLAAGDYLVGCGRTGNDLDPYLLLSSLFGSPDQHLSNFSNLRHPVVDENLEILRTEREFERRYEAVENIMTLFTEQVPFLWTAAIPNVIAVHPALRNIGGWRFPDGTLGDGSLWGSWGQVWWASE
jgi:peptide/nickel transport system substrate-binding protein